MRPGRRFGGRMGLWGDVRCLVCSYVILTLKGAEPGLYQLAKVAEHPGARAVARKKRQVRSEGNGDATEKYPLFYCDTCDEVRPLGIEDLVQDTVHPENGIWGDMVCMQCFSVIAAVKAGEAGIYTFTKIEDLPDDAK
jgi:hypothetical protein